MLKPSGTIGDKAQMTPASINKTAEVFDDHMSEEKVY